MKLPLIFAALLSIFYFSFAADDNVCYEQSFGADSVVCVCDVDHCDYIYDTIRPEPGIFVHYASSQAGARFWAFEGSEDPEPLGNTTIMIDHARSYQRIEGFGGAFTDAAGMNIVGMGPELQEKILRSYFGDDGIDYRMGRIPIAGCDFSVRPYSYDDVEGDVDLEFFELQEEDLVYKIPLITRALELARHQIRLFGSPWAPPAWMKTNGMVNESGGLIDEYREPYSQYLIRFVEEYESNDVPIWGITTQNEPMTGFEDDYKFNTCAFSPEDMRIFVGDFLGPAFQEAGLGGLRVMILDHNREYLPDYVQPTLEYPDSSRYVSGVAVHWYSDGKDGPEVLVRTQEMFPNVFLLYTESCAGWASPEDERVVLGSWERAENYAGNIIESLNAHVTGWVDWNLALDMEGGPNWVDNFVDAPIIVDQENGVFYRQPTYYAMGHFSKFLLQGSDRVYSNVEGEGADVIRSVAFHDPNGVSVCVLLNTDTEAHLVSIRAHSGLYINIELYPKSIETVLFT